MKNTIITSAISIAVGLGAGRILPQQQADVYTKLDSNTIQVDRTISTTINVKQLQLQRDALGKRCATQMAQFDEQLKNALDVGVSVK